MANLAEYRDNTPVSAIKPYSDKNLSATVIAVADDIRHKMFGKDVRESVARCLELSALSAINTASEILKIFETLKPLTLRILGQVDTLAELNKKTTGNSLCDAYIVKNGKNPPKPSVYMWDGKAWVYAYDIDTEYSQIGFIYNESDFTKYVDYGHWFFMNDITISKPIYKKSSNYVIDGNGFNLVLGTNFTIPASEGSKAVFYLGRDVGTGLTTNYNGDLKTQKTFRNLNVNLNYKTDVFLFSVQTCSNLTVDNVSIQNAIGGTVQKYPFTDANGVVQGYGENCTIDNLTVVGDINTFTRNVGLEMIFDKSVYGNIKVSNFFEATRQNCSNSTFKKYSTSGLLHSTDANGAVRTGRIMGIAFNSVGTPKNNTIEDFYIDCCEPLSLTDVASTSNGGLGMYVFGKNIKVSGVTYNINTNSAYKNKHTPFYFTDRNNLGVENISSDISFNNANIVVSNDAKNPNDFILKPYVLRQKNVVENTFTVSKPTISPSFFGCNFGENTVNYTIPNMPVLKTGTITVCGDSPLNSNFEAQADNYANTVNSFAMRPFFKNVEFFGTNHINQKFSKSLPENTKNIYTLGELQNFEKEKISELSQSKQENFNNGALVTFVQGTQYPHPVFFNFEQKKFFYFFTKIAVDYTKEPDNANPSAILMRSDINSLWTDNENNKKKITALETKTNLLQAQVDFLMTKP